MKAWRHEQNKRVGRTLESQENSHKQHYNNEGLDGMVMLRGDQGRRNWEEFLVLKLMEEDQEADQRRRGWIA